MEYHPQSEDHSPNNNDKDAAASDQLSTEATV